MISRRRLDRPHVGRLAAIAVLAAVGAASAAEPFLPTDDNLVLETLPRSLLIGRDELTVLRGQLAANPTNPDVALKAANRFVQLGNVEGDPRFFGYARAALKPWWDRYNPPSAILKLRAKLKEKDHEYDGALVDLEHLLERDPQDAQAWIELANIYRVQGQYAQAWKACQSLSEIAGEVPVTLCRAPLKAVTGQAEEAYASLARILPVAKDQFPNTVQWIRTVQAQLALSLGKDQEAETLIREALAQRPGDRYLLRMYGDHLLDHERAAEAVSLLRDHISDNGILLCAAIAARRSGEHELAAEWASQLESQFDEIRLRGSEPHGRFEARFALEIKDDPRRALSLAAANWQKQKELRDSRNVLEAAIAANDPVAAQPVLEFLKRHNTEDVILQEFARQLERSR